MIQRLFGVQLVFSSSAELAPGAERIAAELQAALVDLRRALQRPSGRVAPETHTTLLEEVERLRREHPDLHLVLTRGSERVSVPRSARAARPVRARGGRAQRAQARTADERSRCRSSATRTRCSSTSATTACRGGPRQTGMGLKLAALEALQAGGIVEFGMREKDTWRVRLAVPV